MKIKQAVWLIEGIILFGAAAMIACWAFLDGIPEYLFFSAALGMFGYFHIRRSRTA